MFSLNTFAALVSVAVIGVQADHQVTFVNRCGSNITPKWKAGSGGLNSGPSMANGASWSTSVPTDWTAGRMYGQNGRCAEPDGAGCTLFECSFGTPGFHQCNISLVSGFNVGMSFDWVGADSSCQGGKNCGGSACSNTQAWLPPDSCNGCLSQCNPTNVGMRVTFCP